MKTAKIKVHGQTYHKATELELRAAMLLYPERKLKRRPHGLGRMICSILSGVFLAQGAIHWGQSWAPYLLVVGFGFFLGSFYSIRLRRLALESRVNLLELEIARLHLESERSIIEECEAEGWDPAPYIREYREINGLMDDSRKAK